MEIKRDEIDTLNNRWIIEDGDTSTSVIFPASVQSEEGAQQAWVQIRKQLDTPTDEPTNSKSEIELLREEINALKTRLTTSEAEIETLKRSR